jgi:hypothetical protein
MSKTVFDILFAIMIAGFVCSKLAFGKMRQEITRSAPERRPPSTQFWNIAGRLRMVRAYREMEGRGTWADVYLASVAALIVPLVLIFACAGIAGLTKSR